MLIVPGAQTGMGRANVSGEATRSRRSNRPRGDATGHPRHAYSYLGDREQPSPTTTNAGCNDVASTNAHCTPLHDRCLCLLPAHPCRRKRNQSQLVTSLIPVSPNMAGAFVSGAPVPVREFLGTALIDTGSALIEGRGRAAFIHRCRSVCGPEDRQSDPRHGSACSRCRRSLARRNLSAPPQLRLSTVPASAAHAMGQPTDGLKSTWRRMCPRAPG